MTQTRLKALDGLRAFAIIAVMLYHTETYFPLIHLEAFGVHFENIPYNGWYGVDLFFVLSGFLIMSQLLKKPLTRENAKRFMIKRFLRIAPAYYLILSFALLIVRIQPDINSGSLSQTEAIIKWLPPYAAHLLFLQDYFFRFPSIMVVFWTLAVEMKFYLLCPVLVYFLLKLKSSDQRVAAISCFYIAYTVLKAAFIMLSPEILYIGMEQYVQEIRTIFHFSLESLIIGSLCACLNANPRVNAFMRRPNIAGFLFFGGFFAFICLMLPQQYHMVETQNPIFEKIILPNLIAIIFGVLVISVVNKCPADRFLSTRLLGYFAKISYCLYLVHILVLSTLQHLKTPGVLFPVDWSTNTVWLCMTVLYFCIAIGFAHILHITVEQPVLKWSKERFSSRGNLPE